jgi:hypothetical protein
MEADLTVGGLSDCLTERPVGRNGDAAGRAVSSGGSELVIFVPLGTPGQTCPLVRHAMRRQNGSMAELLRIVVRHPVVTFMIIGLEAGFLTAAIPCRL